MTNKISIITVVYNSEVTIEDTIKSVIDQNYLNKEFIIVDGLSIDNTPKIISKYIKHINVYKSENDFGIYDAMNKGINLATGDIIGILNSDDVYQDTNVLSEVMSCFNNDPDLDILYGNLVYVKNSDLNIIVRKWRTTPYYPNFFENGNVAPHPTLFVRSNVYKKAGLFNLKYKFASDYDFMLRIFKKHNFKSLFLDKVLVRMRLGGATNKNLINIFYGNKEIIESWKNNKLKFPPQFIFLKILKRLNQFL